MENKEIYKTIWCWFVALVLITGLVIVLTSGYKETCAETDRKQKVRDAYYKRLPNVGDKVELEGVEVVIVKYSTFHDIYTVRYPDGNLSKTSEKEMLDKEILRESDNKTPDCDISFNQKGESPVNPAFLPD